MSRATRLRSLIHEDLGELSPAVFRESAFLYFIINICAFENRVSQKVPSICRILTAYAGKVNVEVF